MSMPCLTKAGYTARAKKRKLHSLPWQRKLAWSMSYNGKLDDVYGVYTNGCIGPKEEK